MSGNKSSGTRATINSELMVAKARAYVQPSLDRGLWNPGIQAVLDTCATLEKILNAPTVAASQESSTE